VLFGHFDATDGQFLRFTSGDNLELQNIGGAGFARLFTSALHRDVSAWYHIVAVWDTTNGTADDRHKLYVNGNLITDYSTRANPSSSQDGEINRAVTHNIGNWITSPSNYFNGYLADIHFIDGQALDPSSFGEFDTNGVWQPIDYAGSYGTNGFHLDFADNSSAAALGYDAAGSNDWTVNNITAVVPSTAVTFPASNSPSTVELLVVGGGGGGSRGGGGGGGFRTNSSYSVTAGNSYNVKVGLGGAGGSGAARGSSGGDSYFDNFIAAGGGAGGGATTSTGLAGGSGGGGGGGNAAGGAGNTPSTSPSQGNSGGSGSTDSATYTNGGGGGGAGASGGNAVNGAAGNGGNGSASSISGSSVTYAGGGGGGVDTAQTAGTGGTGGGGAGGRFSATAGTNGLGGGGGGYNSGGANGGSGVVILRYSNTNADLTIAGGLTYTFANTGGYKIYTFTASSVATSADIDSLVDSPTNGSQTDTGVGGEVVGNYATWNPLATAASLANGNLDITNASAAPAGSSIQLSSGKWYYEFTVSSLTGSQWVAIGLPKHDSDLANFAGYRPDSGQYYNGSGWVGYGATYGVGDVIGVAVDLTANTIQFYKNGIGQGQLSRTFTVAVGPVVKIVGSANFGQRPFAYTAPSGFKALCTTNLAEPTIADGSTAMDVALYTGNGSTQTISGLNFSPDLVWIKNRSTGAISHRVFDAVRGVYQELYTDLTNAEVDRTGIDAGVKSFDSDGFTLGSFNYNGTNQSGESYVAWTWDAGSSTVTNTQGSITSQVRANASAGFSVVTYTGNGTNGATVGHGLNVTPGMVIVKSRSAAYEWPVYHSGLTAGNNLFLHLTNAQNSVSSTITAGGIGAVSSTTFTCTQGIGNINNTNASSATYVAYCWTPVAGYSSFGSYTGNGSADGPFVYTGFRPAYVLIKGSTGVTSWNIVDKQRLGYNPSNYRLFAESSNGENATGILDFTSNGFKIRNTGGDYNDNAQAYIYAAFAEHPFATSRAR
jgi:hypothetical protein